ncbi:hypothetical protein ACRAVF_33850 (plasmid) [Bradyrhizobium oligotrophicum S58]
MHAACYDLARNPPTFDAVAFIVQVAERFGGDAVRIGIAPGPAGGFRTDHLWPYSIDQREDLLARVVLPLFRMLPGAVVERGAVDGFGAGHYTIPWSYFVRCMGKGIRPLRPAQRIAPDRRLVTITLREAEHWPERNSNVPEWLAAAKAIEANGFDVLIIRDSLRAHEQIDGHTTFPDASLDLDWRGAIYRAAVCNLFVSNGPAWFAMACDAPVLVLKPTCEALGACYDSAWFQSCGIAPGGQFPNAPRYHRIAWAQDDCAAIVAAFDGFMTQ